jgi:hypothetical protein
METKLKLNEEDHFYVDLLFDKYQNPLFDHDTAFFEIIDRKKETLHTYKIKKDEVRTNFSRGFLNSFKEAVTNSKEVLGYDVIENGKLSFGPWSVTEFVSNYYAHKKVVDMVTNTEDYRKYLEDNKHLYIIDDWVSSKLINTLEYLPELKNTEINTENFFFNIKSKAYVFGENNYKIIHPFRRTYGDNLVTFKDFLEEIKSNMNNHYPDAIKVVIRKQGIKRFFGITDLNDKPVYYNDSEDSQFEDRTLEWFFIKKDGTIIDFWTR